MKNKSLLIIGALLILLAITLPAGGVLPLGVAHANPNWLPDWGHRVIITIDKDNIDENLTHFAVLVHLSAACGKGGAYDMSRVFDELGSAANRKKIALTKSDGTTQLYVEIERWDHANEQAWLWVKVPSVASGADTELYLYYDSTHADNDAYVGDPSDAVVHNVWDGNFKLVTHMQDDPDTSHVRDSTSNDNDGTKKGAGEPAVTTSGQIDDAQNFDGGDDFIEITDHPSIDITGNLTVEAWIHITEDRNIELISKYEVVTVKLGWSFLFLASNDQLRFYTGGAAAGNPAITVLTGFLDTWIYIVGTYDGTTDIYIDGDYKATAPTPLAPVSSGTSLFLGKRNNNTYYHKGLLDEVRISNIARTPAWIKASHESGRDNLLTFGVGEEAPPPPIAPPEVLLVDQYAWFLFMVFFSVLSFWRQNPALFMLAAGSGLMSGLNWYDIYVTNLGLSMSLLLIAYSLVCVGFAFRYIFWKDRFHKE